MNPECADCKHWIEPLPWDYDQDLGTCAISNDHTPYDQDADNCLHFEKGSYHED